MAWARQAKARNVTHQQKKLNEQELTLFPRAVRDADPGGKGAHGVVLPAARRQPGNAVSARAPRRNLGGYLPARDVPGRSTIKAPPLEYLRGFARRIEGRAASTTMAFVGILRALLKDPEDRQVCRADHSRRSAHVRHGVAVPPGRHLRQPGAALQAASISDMFLYYKEAKDGQILEEGITEAGSWRRSPPPERPTPTTACR